MKAAALRRVCSGQNRWAAAVQARPLCEARFQVWMSRAHGWRPPRGCLIEQRQSERADLSSSLFALSVGRVRAAGGEEMSELFGRAPRLLKTQCLTQEKSRGGCRMFQHNVRTERDAQKHPSCRNLKRKKKTSVKREKQETFITFDRAKDFWEEQLQEKKKKKRKISFQWCNLRIKPNTHQTIKHSLGAEMLSENKCKNVFYWQEEQLNMNPQRSSMGHTTKLSASSISWIRLQRINT